jgi:hypothetical protein
VSWFDGIEKNTFLEIKLDDDQRIRVYFIDNSKGIVTCKLESGKIKKFKEDKIIDLEELENVILEQKKETKNIIEKNVEKISVKTSFLHKIDNFILNRIIFKDNEEFNEIKKNDKELHSTLITILNSFNNAKKIHELDFRFNRTQRLLEQLNNLLNKHKNKKIDLFLAYMLQELDIPYIHFFKSLPSTFYCLKYDIFYFNKSNNQYAFIIAEKLFELYLLNEESLNEFIYIVQKIPNFGSLQAIKNQINRFYNKFSSVEQELIEESLKYIALKCDIQLNINQTIKEQIIFLETMINPSPEYNKLNTINCDDSYKSDNDIKKNSEKLPISNYNIIKKRPEESKINKPKQILILKNNSNYIKDTSSYGSYGSYAKAKTAKDKKDYEMAIKYFKIALEHNEKIESTIKDLSVTYYENGEVEKSRELLAEYENKLSRNLTTYNFLENHYFAIGEYRKALPYIDILLKEANPNRKILLYGKKASCYIKLNDKNQAKILLSNILKIQPDNSYAKRLLEEIEINSLNIQIDIASFGGGLSQFIENTLKNYDEYSGVPPKVVESQDFQQGTLKEVRRIIKEAGRARPKERASYLLTEAKLMERLEPNKEIRSTLAKYCNAMSQNHIFENSPKEVIRFYYLEAFSLEEKLDSVLPQVSFYLLTYIKNHTELLNMNHPSIDETLDMLFNSDIKVFWDSIIDMFISNDTIAKHLIKKFYDNKLFLNKTLVFIKLQNNISFDEFTKKIDTIRQDKQRDYNDWLIRIKSLVKLNSIDEISSQLEKTLEELTSKWLFQLDKQRLNTIKEIRQMFDDYLKQKTFDDRERLKNYLFNKINDLVDEIEKRPTKFSYEGYKPLVENIEKLIRTHFDNVLKASTPEVTLTLLEELSVVHEDNSVSLQISITNSAKSSPISNIKIEIREGNGVKYIDGETELNESIRGGSDRILKFNINVSKEVADNLATDIEIHLSYNSRESSEPSLKTFRLPLRLYTSDDFQKIENVYAPIADGGPVQDKNMFFGRDEYINNIINSLITNNSKSIIIYGQKRSGKSSVLYHLKDKLKDEEKAFCIDFSMGDIIDNLSLTTFYYKILSQIEEELEVLDFEDKETPKFNKPSIETLEKYSTTIFNETLKEFKKSLLQTESWRDKKLIILIDEFTYIYTSISKKELSSNFMKTWKAFIEKNIFSAVLVGQDVTLKFKSQYPNEFGVTEDKRLTYLSQDDTKELIEKPIWNKERDSSRYIGNAISKIVDYTACSPYYLQMFCARIVDYMNRKKAISVTEADIEEIAKTFIEGDTSLTEDKFDNLLTGGDADLETFDIKIVKEVLKQIAKESNTGSCLRDNIQIKNVDIAQIDNIIDDLKRREVISQKDKYLNIKVGLFAKWLLKH